MSTAVSTQKKSDDLTIRERLEGDDFRQTIAKVLPAHVKPERMVRVAIMAITRTPKLRDCDQGSFFRCMMDLSAWGLEPDGRRAHLIPFENRSKKITECQLIIDYKGLAELCYRSGQVSVIHADLVRRGDIFEYNCGLVVKHTPWFLRAEDKRPKDQGPVFAVYCIVTMRDGSAKHEVMSMDEIDGIMRRSSGYQAFKKGYTKTTPWESDWGEMAKKTVFRRCSKWLTLSPEIRDAADRDDDVIDGSFIAHDAANATALETLTERMLAQPSQDTNGDGHVSDDEQPTQTDESSQVAPDGNDGSGPDFDAYRQLMQTLDTPIACEDLRDKFKADAPEDMQADADEVCKKRIRDLGKGRGKTEQKAAF